MVLVEGPWGQSMVLVEGPDGVHRCGWCVRDPLYVRYHDTEWGQPVGDDRQLFEKICLEGFQAGLSWLTILKKRDRFRKVFLDFEWERVTRLGQPQVDRMIRDPGIVRHLGKIRSAIQNARRMVELRERYGSLAAFVWSFEPQMPPPPPKKWSNVPSQTDESRRLSRELKRLGWSFVGPTTCYAMMQASGIVNDHLVGCHARESVEAARKAFPRPGRSR